MEIQLDSQGTTVVLDLLPIFLASIGPSVAEISLLSAHRPLLSFLLSIGAPAVYPTRIFEYNNPTLVLKVEGESLAMGM